MKITILPYVLVGIFSHLLHSNVNFKKMIIKSDASPPITVRLLTVARLASLALAEVEDDAYRNRANFAGRAIRAEDGVGEAIRVIELFE
jgi:hypothetical protein